MNNIKAGKPCVLSSEFPCWQDDRGQSKVLSYFDAEILKPYQDSQGTGKLRWKSLLMLKGDDAEEVINGDGRSFWSQSRKEMFYNGKSRGIGYSRMCCSPFLLNSEWRFLAEWWVLTTDKFRQGSMRCGFLLIPSPLLFLVSKEGESCWVKMYAWLLAVKH